ncbi:TRAP transporter large permease [Halomonas sp. MCCC 1A17488]|uniref:TRAP transporter large permease protein n=1 Tax=Billgrantia sulfidoxydans TaxID=2733484 RepID=A0ABX7W4D8_9GAMM|nr:MULTISPECIES: TRAP transporter large permease [Halomonas]MCE8014997.1 TRAP transporter large permease [Halomonas sp. MCCC 1A17488]MCG3238330.1 TRAP transporter large permease [Halomonas sp. MCCC 1A17488]QPP47919.1 TRAP transporter large permease [Halomonas sp. SS10-MC5]QTP55224.1 TRAP transporter large permease [Halomonas sulfidoxydans]
MILMALLVLLLLLVLSVPVAATLIALGLFLDEFFSPFPLVRALGDVLWSASDSFLLIAIPLFILLGEILVRTGIAKGTYRALESWLSWLPGGLLHANIGTATLFSATSGSSVATAATIGTVAIPQGKEMKYDQRLFTGSIAAGGTLGIMIPPSINLIVYGFLTETSIPRLFAAGLLPGLLLALLFILGTALICLWRPSLGGPSRRHSWRERFSGLRHLVPVLLLFGVVVGSIYAGWATPTEAASLGVIGALLIAVAMRKLSLAIIVEALDGTMRTTGMIMLIIIASYFLNFVLASAGITRELRTFLETAGLGPYATLLMVIALYIVLGFFIETLSLMVITIPIVAPIMIGLGFDPVWFGILLILLIEMALITPPVGLNLYVVQGVRQGGSFNDVMVGAIPYVGIMLLMAVVLVLFPAVALYLPGVLN